VCRSKNITRLIQVLLDLLSEDAESENEQRFATLLRSATLLAQKHGGLQLRHLDTMRVALTSAMCKLVEGHGLISEKKCRQAWDSFGFAVGAQVAPYLMFSDSVEDFCLAVASPLPTPGAGPCAALLAMKGVALTLMSLRVRCHKLKLKGMETGAQSTEELASQLEHLKSELADGARQDSHVYCSLLAVAIFDSAALPEERATQRRVWTERCTEVPLKVARCALEASGVAEKLSPMIQVEAPSVAGDLAAGQNFLLAAIDVSLNTADINIKSSTDGLPHLSSQLQSLRKDASVLRHRISQ